ncbi:hypothetical protein FQN50_009561 [Emmonsiellopsis sp. PD_5]|nr:hypothetical protein FQN50_009561 [Emmonsiellopsis sp. PD_5]
MSTQTRKIDDLATEPGLESSVSSRGSSDVTFIPDNDDSIDQGTTNQAPRPTTLETSSSTTLPQEQSSLDSSSTILASPLPVTQTWELEAHTSCAFKVDDHILTDQHTVQEENHVVG